MSIQEQMKLDMVRHLALLLIDDNPQLTMEQVLTTVFNSDTYQQLLREVTGFYHQSPRYVYAFLKNELKTGSIK